MSEDALKKSARRKKALARNKVFILGTKKGSDGCQHCGYRLHTSILHYHHINPPNKSFAISEAKDRSIETIQEEIDKCILLCPNCHALEHLNKDTELII